jgi:heptosyltransferase-2
LIRFLIIRFSSIGDIVLTTPVIRNLKQQVENAEVHFLTKKQYESILSENPYIDKLHVFDGNLKNTIDELSKIEFDHVIDLHNNIRSNRVTSMLKMHSLKVNKLNWEKWLLVNLKINKLPDVHIVDRYLNTIHYFDVENDMKGLDYFIPEKDNVEINTLPENFKNGYILFAIGAQHFTKKLPVEKIVSICKKINFPLIISGGKEDFETGEIIKNQVGETILNACGKFNLNQSASLVKQAKFVISHDTGLMHIASAFKKDIISVWGNTVPVFGMYPYLSGENSIIVENNNLKCRPCSKIGFKKCPKKHFKCMNDIDESQIIKQVNKLIL